MVKFLALTVAEGIRAERDRAGLNARGDSYANFEAANSLDFRVANGAGVNRGAGSEASEADRIAGFSDIDVTRGTHGDFAAFSETWKARILPEQTPSNPPVNPHEIAVF